MANLHARFLRNWLLPKCVCSYYRVLAATQVVAIELFYQPMLFGFLKFFPKLIIAAVHLLALLILPVLDINSDNPSFSNQQNLKVAGCAINHLWKAILENARLSLLMRRAGILSFKSNFLGNTFRLLPSHWPDTIWLPRSACLLYMWMPEWKWDKAWEAPNRSREATPLYPRVAKIVEGLQVGN